MPNKQQETCTFVLENASSFWGDKSYGVLPTAVWGHVPPYPPQPMAQRWSNGGVCELAEALGSDPSVSSNSHSRAVTWRVAIYKPSLKLTNKSYLKMDGWEMTFLLGQTAYSQVRPVSFRGGYMFYIFCLPWVLWSSYVTITSDNHSLYLII